MTKPTGDAKNTLYCSFCGKSQHEFRKLFSEVGILLAPTRYSVAPEISKPLDYQPPDAPKPPDDPGFSALIPAGNLAGLPALSLPCRLRPRLLSIQS